MVTALGLVVVIVVFDEVRSVVRKRIDDTTAAGVLTGLVVFSALLRERLTLRLAGFRVVVRVEVAVCRDTGHVIHGRGNRRFDAGVGCRRVDGDAAPAADADDADLFGVNVFLNRQEVDGCGKVLGVDVGGSHSSGHAAGLTGEGRVERDGQEAALCHGLRIETGALLFDGAEGTGDRDGGQFAFGIFRGIHISGKGDAVTVDERDLLVVDFIALREDFVPLFREVEFLELCKFSGHHFGFLLGFLAFLCFSRFAAAGQNERQQQEGDQQYSCFLHVCILAIYA